MARCRDALYRQEATQVDSVQAFEQVKIQVQELQTRKKLPVATLQALALIEPSLRHYLKLMVSVSDCLTDGVDASSLWGFMSVLLQVRPFFILYGLDSSLPNVHSALNTRVGGNTPNCSNDQKYWEQD